MTIKLYYNLLFASSRTLYIFLNKTKIPFEKKEVLVQGCTKTVGEHKNLSKLEAIPILEHDGFKIMENVAIIRYLSKIYPDSTALYPNNNKKQAKVNEYLAWQHHNTSFICLMYFQRQYLTPLLSGTAPDPKKVEPFKDRMINCLDQLEEVWLKESKFLTGDDLTIADISCLNDIEQTRMAGYDPKIDRPLLTAWMERVKTSLNPHYEEVMKLIPKQ